MDDLTAAAQTPGKSPHSGKSAQSGKSSQSGESEYEDQYVVPMNIVDMTHGVQYNVGGKKSRQASFLRSVMVVKDNNGDAIGGGTPRSGREERSFRSMVSNAVSRQARRSFGNEARRSFGNGLPAGAAPNVVVPTNDSVTTANTPTMATTTATNSVTPFNTTDITPTNPRKQSTAQKMEMLNTKQQQQQQQILRVTSLENLDYDAMGVDVVVNHDHSSVKTEAKSEISSKTIGAENLKKSHKF